MVCGTPARYHSPAAAWRGGDEDHGGGERSRCHAGGSRRRAWPSRLACAMVSTASGWPWRTPAPAAGAWGRGSEGWKCKKQGEPSTPRRKISAESLRVQCNETTTQAKETSRRLQQRGRREHLRDDRRDNSDGGCACQRARCTIHHQYTQTQRQRVGVRGGATATGAEGGREATWRPIATLRPA